MRSIKTALLALGLLLGLISSAAAANCGLTGGTCFWIGGTGTLDYATDSAHWSITSGSTTCSCEPFAGNSILTFDGSSGAGTVTVNTNISAQSIVSGAFTGTLDFAAHANTITLTAVSTNAFNGSGSGSPRTITLGAATFNISCACSAQDPWNFTTITGLTLTANTATVNITGATNGARTIAGGGLVYGGAWSIGANASGGVTTITGANSFGSLTITGMENVTVPAATTTILTNSGGLTLAGSSGAPISLTSGSTAAGTVSLSAGSPSMTWSAIHLLTFTGGATFAATNSLDQGANVGIAITPPVAAGGGGGYVF